MATGLVLLIFILPAPIVAIALVCASLGGTLSGFIGAAVMVVVAHIVGRARTAPPAHAR